jgi:hypothetical protein
VPQFPAGVAVVGLAKVWVQMRVQMMVQKKPDFQDYLQRCVLNLGSLAPQFPFPAPQH